jgi:hypothetical protein
MENKEGTMDSDMIDESETIEVVLKPMNISEIHKREVKMPVNKYQLVKDLAQTIIGIMNIKGAQSSDVNFLYLGKTLNHELSFLD